MEKNNLKTLLCIPTLNAGKQAYELLTGINKQTWQPSHVLIIDSSSVDDTVDIFRAAGLQIHVIPRNEFNHGRTRQIAVEMVPNAGIVIFLTQDAILAGPDALENLVANFTDEKIGAAYGRQLPREEADSIEAHARLFNYPPVSQLKTMADAPRLGIKTAFISNSFAAYRRTALMAVGGFPSNTILSEDTYVAAKMLLAGWKIAYTADAMVYHSHNYGFVEEFKRYFDIGVFHAREGWIRQSFGQAEGEGMRYVRSESKYLRNERPGLILSAVLRTILKLSGYKLGSMERYLPICLKRRISMHKRFWDTDSFTKRGKNGDAHG